MKLYRIQVHFLVTHMEEKREETLSTFVYAEDKNQAIDAAVFWSDDRLKAISPWFELVTCVKVYNYIISTWNVEEKRMTSAMALSNVFEWKYDWPNNLQQTIDIFKGKGN